jgi:ribonuclease D
MSAPFVALDVETTLDEEQALCLVQLGTAEGSVLVDPLAIEDLQPLARLLADERILKVIHYAKFEQTVLGRRGMVIANVYDTWEVSKQRRGSSAAGHSLLAVARRERDLVVDKHPQLSDWRARPLSRAQREYAALDVELLVGLWGVFEGETLRWGGDPSARQRRHADADS